MSIECLMGFLYLSVVKMVVSVELSKLATLLLGSFGWFTVR